MNTPDTNDRQPNAAVWVIEQTIGLGAIERLGDARRVANALNAHVGVVTAAGEVAQLIAGGADLVVQVLPATLGPATFQSAVSRILNGRAVRLVYAGHNPEGRALAARWAVKSAGVLVSPALLARCRGAELEITGLDQSGRRARRVVVPAERPAVVTIRDGVAQPWCPAQERPGTVITYEAEPRSEPVTVRRRIPLDPSTADIRHVRRLICGGRGVGGAAGFEKLRHIAQLMDAGVAASRVAVDLGWAEYERQVGQTGKTVSPDLYIGCGVSGAAHHLEGMSGSAHVIAINTDPEAPLLKRAHLGLVADLHQVLSHLERALPEKVSGTLGSRENRRETERSKVPDTFFRQSP